MGVTISYKYKSNLQIDAEKLIKLLENEGCKLYPHPKWNRIKRAPTEPDATTETDTSTEIKITELQEVNNSSFDFSIDLLKEKYNFSISTYSSGKKLHLSYDYIPDTEEYVKKIANKIFEMHNWKRISYWEDTEEADVLYEEGKINKFK